METLDIRSGKGHTKSALADRLSSEIRRRLDEVGLVEVAVASDGENGYFHDSIDFTFRVGGRRLPMLLAVDGTGGSVVNAASDTDIPVAGKYYEVREMDTLLSAAVATVWWHVSGKNTTIH